MWLEAISLTFGAIGAISGAWFIYDRLYPFKRFSWKKAEKAAEKIAREMIADNFSPTLIIGIGRGGAIMGALISGCLGHRPLLVIDRKYEWKKGDRIEDMIFKVDIPKEFLEKVLIVAGEVHSGNTMKLYSRYVESIGGKDVRRATFFYEEGSTINVEYIGIKSHKKNVLMPWMFSKSYLRADRHPV